MDAAPADNPAEPFFRPSKRRKVFRKRPEDPAIDHTTCATISTSALSNPSGESAASDTTLQAAGKDDDRPSVTEILRRRKLPKSRTGGIEVINVRDVNKLPISANVREAEAATYAIKQGVLIDDTAAQRFAPQTGMKADDSNKHMMAYIDRKMASLQAKASETRSNVNNKPLSTAAESPMVQRQPAALGRLQEIDLGPEATLLNISRTERATSRLEGVELGQGEETSTTRKVRIGPDGKPWRSRRKRRLSEDIRRDQLVEEVLKESRLEAFDKSDLVAQPYETDSQAADDRLAEQFRREFMEAVNSRSVTKNPLPPSGGKGKKMEDKPKGPKLGGSRSARAAMRAQEEKLTKKR